MLVRFISLVFIGMYTLLLNPVLSQFFTEDFESGSGAYSTTATECNSGSDYFTLTNDAGIPANFTGSTGNYFAAQDIDGCSGVGVPESIEWSGINISGCSSLSFSIDLAEDDDGSNNDWDNTDYVHIFYSIDGGAEQNLIWIHNDGTGFNTPPYIDTDFDGVGDGTEITDAFTTFTQAIAGVGTTIDIRIEISLDSGDEDIAFDNLALSGTCSCPGLDAEPTNEVTDDGPVAGCTSGTINWTLGSDAENVIVVYSTSPITGTPTDGVNYNVGSTISAGEEVIYNGSGNTVSIGGLTQNTTYYYAIFEYNGTLANCEENYLTGGVTGSFTTLSGCQESYIQSINYNACTGSEGTDEIVVVSIGDDAVPVDSLTIDLPNSTWCNTSCGANTIVNNPTYINDLNNLAGCSLFTYCDPIPAGATLMIFTGNPPSTTIDYSGSCGGTGGPYCAIFLDNSSLTGNFSNSASTPRVTTIHFGSSSSSTVSYTATDGVGTTVDGATADFDPNGNVTYVENSNCVYPLAVSLKSFNGHHSNGSNHINWSTVSEENNDYFALYHSMNGKYFDRIGMVQGSGNTTTLMNYTFEHKSPEPGINYYKLESVDYDGTIHENGIISIEFNSGNTYYDYSSNIIHTKSKGDYNVVNLAGQIIKHEENTSEIPFLGTGIYIVQNLNTGEAEKLVIH